MTTYRYSTSVLRYVHDVVTGEFVNVGVLAYSREGGFIGLRLTSDTKRIARVFPSASRSTCAHLFNALEAGVRAQRRALSTLVSEAPVDAAACAARLLPADDSAFQFSRGEVGMTSDLEATLEAVFQRFVQERPSHSRKTRSDKNVLDSFSRPLRDHKVWAQLEAKTIAGADFEHEFQLAWKNGIWNTCEALSFDLAEGADIVDKANKWLGRMYSLVEAPEQFRIHFLVGAPRAQNLMEPYFHAKHILEKAPPKVQVEVVPEDDKEAFASRVALSLRH